MIENNNNVIKFKSKKYVPEVGAGAGLWAKKGTFDGKVLDLGWDKVEIDKIERAELGLPKIMTVLPKSDDPSDVLFLELTDEDTKHALVRAINKTVSKLEAEKEMAECKAKDKPFRSQQCPNCQVTLALSNFEESPQIFCKFCDTIFQKDCGRAEAELGMHLCTNCGLYSMPELFDYTTIWCLGLVFGVVEHHEILCKSCEREAAKRNCCINSIFILGIPCAIAARITAGKVQDLPTKFGDLNDANELVHKGEYREAIKVYEQMLAANPIDAGVRYNVGLTYSLSGTDEWLAAAQASEAALQNCSNYTPAAVHLILCYTKLGGYHKHQTKELADKFGIELPEVHEGAGK